MSLAHSIINIIIRNNFEIDDEAESNNKSDRPGFELLRGLRCECIYPYLIIKKKKTNETTLKQKWRISITLPPNCHKKIAIA